MKRIWVVSLFISLFLLGACDRGQESGPGNNAATTRSTEAADLKAAANTYTQFLKHCRAGDSKSVAPLVTEEAGVVVFMVEQISEKGKEEAREMFLSMLEAPYETKTIDDRTIHLSITKVPKEAKGPVLIIMKKVAGDWKIGDMFMDGQSMVEALGEARGRAERIKCGSQLRQIGIAIMLYEQDNRAYPQSLAVLVDKALITRDVLKCPQSKEKRDCHYFYMPPKIKLGEPNGENVILACDYGLNHIAGRNVLFGDGHTEWLKAADFRKALQQPYNADFAKQLEAAEIR